MGTPELLTLFWYLEPSNMIRNGNKTFNYWEEKDKNYHYLPLQYCFQISFSSSCKPPLFLTILHHEPRGRCQPPTSWAFLLILSGVSMCHLFPWLLPCPHAGTSTALKDHCSSQPSSQGAFLPLHPANQVLIGRRMENIHYAHHSF